MSVRRCDAPSVAAVAALGLVGWTLIAARPYADGPPSGHTGGFGEPTCMACHLGAAENPPDGAFEMAGLDTPVAWDSARVVTLRLARPGLARAGFQLTARFDDGRQAGRFEAIDDRVGIDHDAVQYVIQTETGSFPDSSGAVSWRFRWIAPRDSGLVRIHAAANAANGDDSPLGDAILTREWILHLPIR